MLRSWPPVIRKRLKSVLFGIATGVLLLVLLEALARVVFSSEWFLRRIQLMDMESSSCRVSWVHSHPEGKERTDDLHMYDPITGWRYRPNVHLHPATNVTITTNLQGFRSTHDYSRPNHTQRPRIMVLGDSFAFGLEVSDSETYAYYLQEMLPEVDVLNLGMGGYGLDQILLLLQQEGAKYKPDVVILGFVYLDMYRDRMTFFGAAKPMFTISNHRLRLTNVPVPRPENMLKWEWIKPKLLDLWRMGRYAYELKTHENDRRARQLGILLLNELADTIESIGAIPVFVYCPDPWDMATGGKWEDREDFFLEYSHVRKDVHAFSLRPFFLEIHANEPMGEFPGMLYRAFHWSPLGHLTAAKAIRDYLSEHDLIKSHRPTGKVTDDMKSPLTREALRTNSHVSH